MRATLDESTLAELLPGSWTVAATNFPMWLKGDRREPTFTYELMGTDPLVLSDVVSYLTLDRVRKTIIGRDRWAHGGFKWRGAGRLSPFSSHWAVTGASEDGSVLALHFSRSLGTPAGIDIIVREGAERPEVRALIARATEEFGITPEEFASLTWMAPVTRG